MATLEFYKLRPDNFPTIRLSQLAVLYNSVQNVFEKCISCNDIQAFYKWFACSGSAYWDTHYNFDNESTRKRKIISKNFMDLVIINTIIPLQFAYSNAIGKDNSEDIMKLIRQIQPEKNAIIQKFSYFNIPSKTAFDSQSLLQLKKEYCENNKCLSCAIGIHLIKN